MPEIGEVKIGTEIGLKAKNRFIWAACIHCGKERWVRRSKDGKINRQRCRICAQKGEFNNDWKGGRKVTGDGYVELWVHPNDFFYPMANKKGYVREHRLVVAKALNRYLLPWEVVHHKGKKYPLGSVENKQDNRYPENLELLPGKKYHLVDTVSRSLIANLQKRVTLLEAENILLKEQISLSYKS